MFEVIVNPAGAAGKTMQAWEKVETYLHQHDIAYRAYYSDLQHDVVDIIKEIMQEEGEKDIILIGGDGSLNLLVNGIDDFSRIRLGLIPCGSGNDFALAQGISKKPLEQLEKIIKKEVVRELDIGQVEYFNQYDMNNEEVHLSPTRRFNISCGIGFDAEICEKAEAQNKSLKKHLNKINVGKLIYLSVAMKLIFSIDHYDVKIKVDGKEYPYNQLVFAAIMNEPYEGGGFKFSPNAIATDGEYEICVANNLGVKDFWRIFPYAYKGNHVKFEGIELLHGKEVEVTSTKPMWVHTDGEVECQTTHMKVTFINDKLRMLN